MKNVGAQKPVILIVDDQKDMRDLCVEYLGEKYECRGAKTGAEALDKLGKSDADVVLLDVVLPDMNGLDVLKKIRPAGQPGGAEVIMISVLNMAKTAIQAVKLGAYDYLSKPFDADELLLAVEKALEKRGLKKEVLALKSELSASERHEMVGRSAALRKVLDAVRSVAGNDSTVLITGESGTGKELVARAIHKSGLRKEKPFIAVDSGAIPADLVESELFGHEKGAFTDAAAAKPGKFELADGGTLFLDEVGNLGREVQGKLLRAIEEKEFTRVGGTKPMRTDARIIAATNTDLAAAVKQGAFRQDLFYRLNVIPVGLPPLRDRKEDIPLLAEHFRERFNRRFGKKVKGFAPGVLESFSAYSWPGNVRELRNVVERLVAVEKGEVITESSLPQEIISDAAEAEDSSLKSARDDFEKQHIIKALEQTGWNQTQAAKLLGIHRNALLYKMEKHKISR